MLVCKITPFCGHHVRYAKDMDAVTRIFLPNLGIGQLCNGELHRESHVTGLLYNILQDAPADKGEAPP